MSKDAAAFPADIEHIE